MIDIPPRERPFHCPDEDEIRSSTFALLPRGRAWQTHEAGPQKGFEAGFDQRGYQPFAFQTDQQPRSVLFQFFAAIAQTITFMAERICALRLEFWCATQSETTDGWMAEYGLPDACDPYPNLCAKVAAFGGARCEFYQFIAARAGWSLTCGELNNSCGTRVGSSASRAGRMRSGRRHAAEIVIIVDLAKSPAYTRATRRVARSGRFRAGWRAGCGPDIGPLECILARIVHAHLHVTYGVIND